MAKNGDKNGARQFPVRLPPRLIKVQIGRFPGIELCPHAIDRMNERGVSDAEVIEAIRQPMRKGLPTQPGRKHVRRRRPKGGFVHVVYKELPSHILVITVIVR